MLFCNIDNRKSQKAKKKTQKQAYLFYKFYLQNNHKNRLQHS